MRIVALILLLILLSGCASTATSHSPASVTKRDGDSRLADHRSESPESEEEGEEEADHPEDAIKWHRQRLVNEHGRIPRGALATAIEQRQQMIEAQAGAIAAAGAPVFPAQWTNRGPANIGGRTRSLLIQPSNPNVLISGSVGGGIFKSTDGGTTWRAVNDGLPNLAICCLARDPANENILYAGTGEGFFNSDAVTGMGIFKSIDAGETWALMPSTTGFDNVCRIAISPANSNIILISKRYGGVLRSTDGGATWSTRYSAQGSFFVAFHPTDANKAVATVIDHDGAWFHRALYSTDAGNSWTQAASGLTRIDGFSSRIELAYAPSDPSIVYASCASGGVIWRSTDGGQNYVLQTTTGSSGSSWYCCPIWVNPTNANMLVVGGTHTFKSTNAGGSLTQISNGYILTANAHPDIHLFVADPGFNGVTNRRVYVCTDGGVHRTDNIDTATSTSGWVSLQNTYRATQFYSAVGHGPTGRVVGGTQDNGHLTINSASPNALLTFGGDGGFSAMEAADPNYIYGEYVYLQIHRSSNGGTSASYIDASLGDAGSSSTASFIAPFVLDPNNANTLLAGGTSLWRTINAKASPTSAVAWTSIKPAATAKISAIAVAPGNSSVIWVAQTDGKVYRTANGTAATPTWTTVDDNSAVNPLPNRFCSRLLIDPANSSVVYACFGGFSANNVLKSVNNGATWSDITGLGATGLPDVPVFGIARHPTLPDCLFVATQIGVFQTRDGGVTWTTANIMPANVRTDEVNFMTGSNTLVVGTHGRGIWTAPANACAGDIAPGAGNGFVDTDDLLALLGAWGACVSPPVGCVGDIQPGPPAGGDGQVNTDDLLMLLGAWGACP